MSKFDFILSKLYDEYCLKDDPFVTDMDEDTFQTLIQLINLSEGVML